MKLTTKIALVGLFVIFFIIWLSFFYLNPGSDEEYIPTVTPEMTPWFPETGIDVVLTWIPPNSLEYQQSRELWYYKTIEVIDDNLLRGETRRYNYRGVDYFRFILRAVDYYIEWARHVVIVYPDDTVLSPSLNTSSPRVKLVPHSKFIPREYLPTFNPEVIKLHLHLIPHLTTEFVYINENTLILQKLELSLFRKADTGAYLIRTTDPSVLPSLGYITDESKKATYQISVPIQPSKKVYFDTLGPVLFNKNIMEETFRAFSEYIKNTSSHRFPMPSDVCAADLYFIFLFKEKTSKNLLVIESSLTEYVSPETDIGATIESAFANDRVAIFVVDEVIRGRFRSTNSELDVLLFQIYPKLSRLELNIEDYANLGLSIALVILFGGIGCCYVLTRALGGHIKRDKFG